MTFFYLNHCYNAAPWNAGAPFISTEMSTLKLVDNAGRYFTTSDAANISQTSLNNGDNVRGNARESKDLLLVGRLECQSFGWTWVTESMVEDFEEQTTDYVIVLLWVLPLVYDDDVFFSRSLFVTVRKLEQY